MDAMVTAKRLLWGKTFNCGQTCIGPDYVLCVRGHERALIEALQCRSLEFFGTDPQHSDLCRLVSKDATKRMAELMKDGEVVVGGHVDIEDRYCEPTIVLNPPHDSRIMTEEIFGPMMPILVVDSVDEAVAFVGQRPVPLALYVFTSSSAVQKDVATRTRSGALGINDLVLHFSNPHLPFGGMGEAGWGAYHGDRTFKLFTHQRAVVKHSHRWWVDIPLRYFPYNAVKTKLANFFTSM
jgi:acyl-CoA reductase-like NAD-dependent aldehyde dehydrogenase